MNVIAEIQRINERELELGVPYEGSWHQKYRASAWVYIGGLPFELTEGDVLCVMSQFGEIEDVNLVRDGVTGKSKGFAFLKYEDQRSTVLAVDNMNGARVLERVLRVDHVLQYKLPKEIRDREDARDAEAADDSSSDVDKPTERVRRNCDSGALAGQSRTNDGLTGCLTGQRPRGLPGHAYDGKELDGKYDLSHGHNVFAAPEESKRERKKRRKEDKKAAKRDKKLRKLEAKQAELFAEIQRKRQLAREQELRDLQQQRSQTDDDAAEVEASSTGWRGRMEPNAAPRRPAEGRGGGRGSGSSRRNDDDGTYGGLHRTR